MRKDYFGFTQDIGIYPSKQRPSFSLRKPRIRTFYTDTAQNVDVMKRHYLILKTA